MAVYVVWSPQVDAQEDNVAGGAKLIPDARVTHYWDPESRVGTIYTPVLAGPLGRDYADLAESGFAAWDVWMLFDRNVLWDDAAPPAPMWWEHQLGDALPSELRLDPERFASKATGR